MTAEEQLRALHKMGHVSLRLRWWVRHLLSAARYQLLFCPTDPRRPGSGYTTAGYGDTAAGGWFIFYGDTAADAISDAYRWATR